MFFLFLFFMNIRDWKYNNKILNLVYFIPFHTFQVEDVKSKTCCVRYNTTETNWILVNILSSLVIGAPHYCDRGVAWSPLAIIPMKKVWGRFLSWKQLLWNAGWHNFKTEDLKLFFLHIQIQASCSPIKQIMLTNHSTPILK